MTKVLHNIVYKIRLSKFYRRLDDLNDLYDEGQKDEYLQGMEVFYNDLRNLPCTEPELFAALDQDLTSGNADRLYGRSGEIRNLLDRCYSNSSVNKKRYRKPVLIAVIGALILILAILYSPLKARYYEEQEQYFLAANEELHRQKTFSDILLLQEALQKYFNDNKSYPKSSGGWDAVIANYGQSKQEYIPGLIPKYLKSLPADPRNSKDPGKQYMYRSDGTDFKLIAHRPVGIEDIIKEHANLVDPARPSWAFGVWSKGAENW